MIFVTIGSMFPFDRLIRAMDEWASLHPSEQVFAQIGEGAYEPRNMPFERMLTPTRFREIYDEAGIIVAHAGMGSVISAAEIGKPIVIVPRRAAWKEHTTDHQLHTAQWLRRRPGTFVAEDDSQLAAQIEAARGTIATGERLPTTAPAAFVDRIRQCIAS